MNGVSRREGKTLFPINISGEQWWLFLLWLLVLSERIAFTIWDKTGQSFIVSDSEYYYQSGLDLIRTGRLIYRGCPTALIMPGISVLIGLLSLVFSEGLPLLYSIRVLWLLMGSLVPLILYRTMRLFSGHWPALLVAAVYLMPWHVQIDCFLLTECPYYLFFSLALYYTLKMGEDDSLRLVWCWAISVLAGLMFRPNILILVVFSFVWLIIRQKYTWREIGRRAIVLCTVLAIFIIPWTIRNWHLYHAFIPVSYGAANPLFEGTYQGVDIPTEKEMGEYLPGFDAYAAVSAKRPDLVDVDGNVFNPEMQQYVDMLVVGELAHFRLRAWWGLRPTSFLTSYLYVKPRQIVNWVWYYIELGGISFAAAHRMRQMGFLFCICSVCLSVKRKRFVKQTVFLASAYFANLYLLASSYAIDRYAQMIMPYRYLLCGFGLELLITEIRDLHKRRGIRLPG